MRASKLRILNGRANPPLVVRLLAFNFPVATALTGGALWLLFQQGLAALGCVSCGRFVVVLYLAADRAVAFAVISALHVCLGLHRTCL